MNHSTEFSFNKIKESMFNEDKKGPIIVSKTYNPWDKYYFGINPKRTNFQMTKSQKFKNTIPCRHILNNGECHLSYCTFAHSIEELNAPNCMFDKSCRKIDCRFIHSNESRDQWIERMGYKRMFESTYERMFESISIRNINNFTSVLQRPETFKNSRFNSDLNEKLQSKVMLSKTPNNTPIRSPCQNIENIPMMYEVENSGIMERLNTLHSDNNYLNFGLTSKFDSLYSWDDRRKI